MKTISIKLFRLIWYEIKLLLPVVLISGMAIIFGKYFYCTIASAIGIENSSPNYVAMLSIAGLLWLFLFVIIIGPSILLGIVAIRSFPKIIQLKPDIVSFEKRTVKVEVPFSKIELCICENKGIIIWHDIGKTNYIGINKELFGRCVINLIIDNLKNQDIQVIKGMHASVLRKHLKKSGILDRNCIGGLKTIELDHKM